MTGETLGQRLRRLRLLRELSQRELSTEHVSYAYISRIEAGQRRPSVRALREIAPKLGVSAHYLETGEEEPVWTAWRVIELLLLERGLAAPGNGQGSSQEPFDLDLLEVVREEAKARLGHDR